MVMKGQFTDTNKARPSTARLSGCNFLWQQDNTDIGICQTGIWRRELCMQYSSPGPIYTSTSAKDDVICATYTAEGVQWLGP